jgi:hypothetical protein
LQAEEEGDPERAEYPTVEVAVLVDYYLELNNSCKEHNTILLLEQAEQVDLVVLMEVL